MALVVGIQKLKKRSNISLGLAMCFAVACGAPPADSTSQSEITTIGSGTTMQVSLVGGQLHATRCGWIDFDLDGDKLSLPAGAPVTDAYASYGVNISTFARNGTTPGLGIVFDSANPTGGDWDLGTPNSIYGGPGLGNGGWSNTNSLDGLLIKAENTTDANGDGLIDVPDDDASGAKFNFDFNEDMCVRSAGLVDIEVNETPVHVEMQDASSSVVADHYIGGLGNNSAIWAPLGDCGVRSMSVELRGSGAMSHVSFCSNQLRNVYDNAIVDDLDDVRDIEFDIQVEGLHASNGWVPMADGHFKQYPFMLNHGGILPDAPLTPTGQGGDYSAVRIRIANVETIHFDGTVITHASSPWHQLSHAFNVPTNCGAFMLEIDYDINVVTKMDLASMELGLEFASAATASSQEGCQ